VIVLPKIGELRAHEIETSSVVLDRVCQTTRDEKSARSAKIVKSVIRNVCMFGVRVGAFESNPARDIGRIESKKARNRPAMPRAMSVDEVFDLLGKLDADEAAVAADLPDLVRLFLATGERTAEALAADWEDFDPTTKQLTRSGNVIRAPVKARSSTAGRPTTRYGRSRSPTGARPCSSTGARPPRGRSDLPQLDRHDP
jgi:integrase